MHRYHDRRHAGQILAHRIRELVQDRPTNPVDTVVLALPRGGVPVAFEIACAIHAPLDLLLVKKIAAPSDPEFAVGAICEIGEPIYDFDSIQKHQIDLNDLDSIVELKTQEMREQGERLRQGKEMTSVRGRNVILVDDGMATGNTMKVAVRAVRRAGCSHLIVAIPVAPPSAIGEVEKMADLVVCPLKPALFVSVGGWYRDFVEVTDRDVISILEGLKDSSRVRASI